MTRYMALLLTPLFFTSSLLFAEAAGTAPPSNGPTPSDDTRQFVSMPDEARALMRQDMQTHLSTLNEIIGHLASGNLEAAAEVAEARMGNGAIGKHRASGMGPGRFMPPEMRTMGWELHAAASEFAQIARQGDTRATYAALQKITTTCIVCHNSYRTR